MIDYLAELLGEFSYEVIGRTEDVLEVPFPGILVRNKDSEVTDFLLIIGLEDITMFQDDDSELTETIYRKLRELETNQSGFLGVSKNTSLIICWNIQSKEELNNNQRFIHKIEEDPYQIKKYVLWYQDNELSELKNELGDIDYNLLQEELLDSSNFSDFKANPSNPSGFSLLSRIFIKVPALKIEATIQELYDLQNKIDGVLAANELDELEQFVLQQEFKDDEDKDKFVDSLLDNFRSQEDED